MSRRATWALPRATDISENSCLFHAELFISAHHYVFVKFGGCCSGNAARQHPSASGLPTFGLPAEPSEHSRVVFGLFYLFCFAPLFCVATRQRCLEVRHALCLCRQVHGYEANPLGGPNPTSNTNRTGDERKSVSFS